MNGARPVLAAWWGVAAVTGFACGLLLQLWLSSRGAAPGVPPVSLTASLVVLAGVLLALGWVLRRALRAETMQQINPFHAVRVLAGARAGQLLGALSAGAGGGMLVQILTRTVVPGAGVWGPMASLAAAGLLLLLCGVIVERWCQVPPPADHDPDGVDPAPLDAPQAA